MLVPRAGVRAAAPPAVSPCLPTTQQTNAAFDLAGIGRLGPAYPRLPRIGVDDGFVPPVILRAIAWIESNWRQFDDSSLPLLSPDFGYGVMQITSGMAGSNGPQGSIPLNVQGRIGGDYLFNIAYAARMLAEDFRNMPQINDGDPADLENWYYAIWAYNGWGWVNNPNNPAFTRQGNPVSDPGNYPYQERVYYLLRHPPVDASGRPLWPAVRVALPKAWRIGTDPGPLVIRPVHQDIPGLYAATYDTPDTLLRIRKGSSTLVHVRVYNASGVPWLPVGGQSAFGLLYHWVKRASVSNPAYDPNLGGVDVRDGTVVPISTPVRVGDSVSVPVELQPPPSAGVYLLEWDMWGRAAGWFSYSGTPPGTQTITVVPETQWVPPYIEPPAPVYMVGNHAKLVSTIANSVPTVMHPGQSYSRTVLLFNPGGNAWNSGYGVEELSMSAIDPLPLPFVAGCRTMPLTLQGQAPSHPGPYVVEWRLVSSNFRPFGPIFRFVFKVQAVK